MPKAFARVVMRSFTPDEFDKYVESIKMPRLIGFKPIGITLHSTSAPTSKQCGGIITHERMVNLLSFYRDERKWSAGPHLFIDTKQIWVFTPINIQGTHSPTYNKTRFGIEMLGDHDVETPNPDTVYNSCRAMATLCRKIGKSEMSINFHRDDPKTTHRECPGTKISKSDIRSRVSALLAGHDSRLSDRMPVTLSDGTASYPDVAYILRGESSALACVCDLNGIAGIATLPDDKSIVSVKTFYTGRGYLVTWDDKSKTILLSRK